MQREGLGVVAAGGGDLVVGGAARRRAPPTVGGGHPVGGGGGSCHVRRPGEAGLVRRWRRAVRGQAEEIRWCRRWVWTAAVDLAAGAAGAEDKRRRGGDGKKAAEEMGLIGRLRRMGAFR